MFIIYGRRKARIKKYTDNQHACKSCGFFDVDVKIYRDYYHLCFIPVFPVGYKTVKARCNNCGEPIRLELIQKHYESITKTPIYLYTISFLFAVLTIIIIKGNINTQKDKERFVDSPMVGDVYQIRKDEKNSTSYYFLRVSQINGDSIFTYHNNLIYNGYTSELDDDDFFVKQEVLAFTKKDLKEMLQR